VNLALRTVGICTGSSPPGRRRPPRKRCSSANARSIGLLNTWDEQSGFAKLGTVELLDDFEDVTDW